MEATASFDFAAQEEGDLGFKRGDMLKVLNKEDNNWYYGELRGKKGQIPRTYLEMEPHEWYKGKMSRADAEAFLMRTGASGQHAYQDGTFILRDSESGKSNFSLSVKHGSRPQHFLIQATEGGEYYLWPHQSFPSINKLIAFYRHTSVSQKAGVTLLLRDRGQADSNGAMYEALHDFAPESPDEVAFKRRDRIQLIAKTDDDWWTGKVIRTGEQGLFPRTFVEEVK